MKMNGKHRELIMKKSLWIVFLASQFALQGGALSARASTSAASPTLEDDINSLKLPDSATPQANNVSTEKLYSFQTRYSPLGSRSEFDIQAARNFSGDSFLSTNQLGLAYRIHLSDRVNLALDGAYVFNGLTDSANRLYEVEKILPDVAYVHYRGDLMVGYNLFYGKIRPGIDSNVYFDQYIALGGGAARLDTGTVPEAVADVGFAFWLGKSGSFRFGFKDYYFQETRRLSQSNTHNLTGYVGIGILLGGAKAQEESAL